MASYGKDFYGLSKYGRPLVIDFYVEPFTALPEGYGKIKVSWTSPSGTWTQLRLLKSKTGWAVNERDGEILLDQTSSASTFTDVNLQGGTWYYYTLYLKSGDTWNQVGRASSLAVSNAGYTEKLLDRVPKYFRYIPRYVDGSIKEFFTSAEVYDSDRIDQNNYFLDQFFSILGWGFDYLKNFHDTVLQATNPRTAEIRHVENLALTLGTQFEYEVPATVVRSKVENAGLLAQRRGTVQGLRDVAALSTGYDIVIDPGTNMYLNEDQASFYHPQFEEWDAGVNYPVDYQVQFAGRVYKALTGALGQAQSPPTHPTTSNTWWILVANGTSNLLSPSPPQGNGKVPVSTWSATTPSPVFLEIPLTEAIGVSSPLDAASNTSNSLKVTNTLGSSTAIEVYGITNVTTGGTQAGALEAVTQGIPIPRLHIWNPSTEYRIGTFVVAGNRSWKCIRDNTDRYPEMFPSDWELAGVDERLSWVSSVYAHADFDNTAGSVIDPKVEFYDERGSYLSTSSAAITRFFDPFNTFVTNTWDTRVVPHVYANAAGYYWTTRAGSWDIAPVDEATRVAWGKSGASAITTTELPPSPIWTGGDLPYFKFGVTFKRDAVSPKENALVFRYVDGDNYSYVYRNGVRTVVAGVTSTPASGDYSSNPIVEGNRVVVNIDVAGNVVRVYVNDVLRSTHSGTITQPAAGGSGGGARFRCGMAVFVP